MNIRVHTLLALSAGDALGAATEFRSADEIQATYGQVDTYEAGSPFGFQPGEATDDTQMVLATLVGYRKRNVLRGLLEWSQSRPPGIGQLTGQALRHQKPWGGMVEWVGSNGQSASNGGLARASAVFVQGLTGEALVHEAVYVTALTHADPRCLYAGAFLAALLEELSQGGDAGAHDRAWARIAQLKPSMLTEQRELHPERDFEALKAKHLIRRRSEQALEDTHNRIQAALRGEGCEQSGFVLDTLHSALVHGQASGFLEGVQGAVAAGGDTDTVACIAGALLGARGLPVPPHLLAPLRVGHTWPGWQREWLCIDHYPAFVPQLQTA